MGGGFLRSASEANACVYNRCHRPLPRSFSTVGRALAFSTSISIAIYLDVLLYLHIYIYTCIPTRIHTHMPLCVYIHKHIYTHPPAPNAYLHYYTLLYLCLSTPLNIYANVHSLFPKSTLILYRYMLNCTSHVGSQADYVQVIYKKG